MGRDTETRLDRSRRDWSRRGRDDVDGQGAPDARAQPGAWKRSWQQLKAQLLGGQGDDLAAQAVDVDGIKVLAARLDGADAKIAARRGGPLQGPARAARSWCSAPPRATRSPGGRRRPRPLTRASQGRRARRHVGGQVGGKGGGRPTWRRPAATIRPGSTPRSLRWRNSFAIDSESAFPHRHRARQAHFRPQPSRTDLCRVHFSATFVLYCRWRGPDRRIFWP